MRNYIRHPSDIPIDFQPEELTEAHSDRLKNISQGGLAFQSSTSLAPGSIIRVKIPLVSPVFQAVGRVTWCHGRGDQFEIGIEFLDLGDVFRVRMVEQLCHIEHFRQQILEQEGRELTSEQAAAEWIQRFAPDFPGSDDNSRT
ncbi:MAG TPA: PilZ domain-containing protein [Gammaproteobacteria bacterium]|nr:PilZ domain-containing protein [Gammaproteobacteria bacterium]